MMPSRRGLSPIRRRRATIAVVAALLGIAAMTPPARAEDCAFKTPPDIAVGKELMITDLSVVDDARATGPDGAWSFGHLMAALVPSREAGRLVKNWLQSWETASSVNGFALEPRPAIAERLIRPWMAGDRAASLADWTPDLAHAPFRLLAIVYRPDLGIVAADNTIASAGEARFVFTALDLARDTDPDRARPLPFTVILEYTLPASDRDQVRAWAERWHRLGKLPFGAAFNAALQAITDGFDGAAGGDVVVRLRSNDGLGLPWQLREFRFDAAARQWVHAPVRNTPHLSLIDRGTELSAFINANRGDDIAARFIGGSAEIPDGGFRWPRLAIANNVLRHNFAMLTCNGCHAAETGRKADAGDAAQPGFRHIGGRLKGEPATLSEFLTGNPAVVPDPTGKLQTFCDLKMRQKALVEALQPQPATAATAPPAVDLSVARGRKDRTD